MSYVYDAKNRVTGFTDPEGNQTTFTYDNMGRVVQVSHPNDTETTQVYNEQNRLVSTETTGDHEGVLSSFSYIHDNVGNRLSMTEKDGNITTYQYDELNRLIHVDYPQRDWEPILTDMEKNNGTLMGKGNKKGHFKKNPYSSETCLPSAVSYQYDAVGNRLSHTDDWQTVAYQYNQANQVLATGAAQFTYDVNGNRISKVEDGEAAHYTYNYDDLMVQVDSPNSESTGYGYDALNRRIYKVNQDGDTTDYLYDGIEVLQEITGNLEQKMAIYYRVNGRILTRQEFNVAQGTDKYLNRPTGRQLYYTYEGLGSVASISNHQGVLQSRYHYDAFGKIEEGDITENPYGFTGKRFDEETGMYKFHFRSYDPVTGVWATPDPIGILGGVNFYAYVKNNPVKWVDPLGLELEEGDDGFNDQGWGGDSGVDAEENGFQGDLGDYGDRDGGDTSDTYPYRPTQEDVKRAYWGATFGFKAALTTAYNAIEYSFQDTLTTMAWGYTGQKISQIVGLTTLSDVAFSKAWSSPLALNAYSNPQQLVDDIDKAIRDLLEPNSGNGFSLGISDLMDEIENTTLTLLNNSSSATDCKE